MSTRKWIEWLSLPLLVGVTMLTPTQQAEDPNNTNLTSCCSME
jgi:hypothetical protein